MVGVAPLSGIALFSILVLVVVLVSWLRPGPCIVLELHQTGSMLRCSGVTSRLADVSLTI